MKKKITIQRSDERSIEGFHYDTPNAETLIVFMHGFPKAQSLDNNFLGFLAEEVPRYGVASLIFDYSFCDYDNGEAQKFAFLSVQDDMDAIYSRAEKQGYKHIGIIAEGLGASFMVRAAPENCAFSILCWPAFDLKHVAHSYFKIDQKTDELREFSAINHNDLKVGQVFTEELLKIDLTGKLNAFHAPTLILHGEKDDVFPQLHLDAAREHLMAKRLEITLFDDAEHGLMKSNDRKSCLLHIEQFLKRYIP